MATKVFITVPNDQPHKVDVISRFLDVNGQLGAEIERIIIDPGESFELVVNDPAEKGTMGVQIVVQERTD